MDPSVLNQKMSALRAATRQFSVARSKLDGVARSMVEDVSAMDRARAFGGGLLRRITDEPIPPPEPLDPNLVMDEARRRALKVGSITASLAIWREAALLYGVYVRGEPMTGVVMWTAVKRVGNSGLNAAIYASRRHVLVVGLDATARVIAYQSARRAKKSALHKVIFVVAKRFAGKANVAVTSVEVFLTMHKDIKRYRTGQLSQRDFVTNCALTGVSVGAPAAGAAIGGPAGATVGLAVSIGASMLKK